MTIIKVWAFWYFIKNLHDLKRVSSLWPNCTSYGARTRSKHHLAISFTFCICSVTHILLCLHNPKNMFLSQLTNFMPHWCHLCILDWLKKMYADFVSEQLHVGWCCIVITSADVLPPSTVGCLDSKHSSTYLLSS